MYCNKSNIFLFINIENRWNYGQFKNNLKTKNYCKCFSLTNIFKIVDEKSKIIILFIVIIKYLNRP